MRLLKTCFVLLIMLVTGIHCTTMAQPLKIMRTCSAKVDANYYKALFYSDKSIAIIRQSDGKKCIWKDDQLSEEEFSLFEFIDFNNDGYKDLRIDYFTNVPDINDMILYNPKSKSFIKVDKFGNFPAATHIPHTNLYYSYHRSGCADMNWDSDLFVIDNFKAVAIGNISGLECNNSDVKDGIYISKVNRGKLKLYKKMPISKLYQYGDKWSFIKQYWEKHNREFFNTK